MQYSYTLIIVLLVSITFFTTLTYVNVKSQELETFNLEHSQEMNEELLQKEIEISPLTITIK